LYLDDRRAAGHFASDFVCGQEAYRQSCFVTYAGVGVGAIENNGQRIVPNKDRVNQIIPGVSLPTASRKETKLTQSAGISISAGAGIFATIPMGRYRAI